MSVSGWCSGPPGARPDHVGCRWPHIKCGCDCHPQWLKDEIIEIDLKAKAAKAA